MTESENPSLNPLYSAFLATLIFRLTPFPTPTIPRFRFRSLASRTRRCNSRIVPRFSSYSRSKMKSGTRGGAELVCGVMLSMRIPRIP